MTRRPLLPTIQPVRDPEPMTPPCALIRELRRITERAHPAEAVAAVFRDNHRLLSFELANRAADPTSGFDVNPLDFALVEHAARMSGHRLHALFHSHPCAAATPSAADLAAAWPGVEMWIGATRGSVFELRRFDAGGRPLFDPITVPMLDPM